MYEENKIHSQESLNTSKLSIALNSILEWKILIEIATFCQINSEEGSKSTFCSEEDWNLYRTLPPHAFTMVT